ncbi:MAG: hypothetical protein ACD_37C00639G0002 [uncultured bacterium]|nr:MAG: hypothetical protein ACD_37C00639G0002 [uncultured bacterium]
MKLVKQAFILIASFLLVFVWEMTTLSLYTIPVIGALIFFYLIFSFRKKGRGFLNLGGDNPWIIFVLNTLILLLIFTTEGINSPIFFLLYFLGFGVAFVFEPMVVFVFVFGVILIFLPDVLKNDVATNVLKIASLLLISPLAFFFSSEYKKSDKQEQDLEKIKEREEEAGKTIAEDVEEVIEENQTLSPDSTEKLNEILEEADDLRREAKE